MERGWWLGDGLPRQCGQCRCTAGAAGYPQQHPGWRALAMRGWRAAQGMRSESRPSRLAMESRWRSAGGAYIDRSTAEWDRWALTRRLRGYPDPSSLRWLVGGAESAAPLGARYVALRAARREGTRCSRRHPAAPNAQVLLAMRARQAERERGRTPLIWGARPTHPPVRDKKGKQRKTTQQRATASACAAPMQQRVLAQQNKPTQRRDDAARGPAASRARLPGARESWRA